MFDAASMEDKVVNGDGADVASCGESSRVNGELSGGHEHYGEEHESGGHKHE